MQTNKPTKIHHEAITQKPSSSGAMRRFITCSGATQQTDVSSHQQQPLITHLYLNIHIFCIKTVLYYLILIKVNYGRKICILFIIFKSTPQLYYCDWWHATVIAVNKRRKLYQTTVRHAVVTHESSCLPLILYFLH